MSRRLHRDLARWTAGEMTLEDLESRHPHAEIPAMAALHGHLTALTDSPTPDPETAWASVSAQLAGRVSAPARATRLRRPVVAAIVAAVLVGPTAAYAAAPDAVRSVVGAVTALLPGVDATGHQPADDNPVPTTVSDPPAANHEDGGETPSDESDPGGAPGSDDSSDPSLEGDGSTGADATEGGASSDGAEIGPEDGTEPPSSGSDPETTTSTTETPDDTEPPEPG